jgi:hypothetical protein
LVRHPNGSTKSLVAARYATHVAGILAAAGLQFTLQEFARVESKAL